MVARVLRRCRFITCNARQVCSACREQERIKALPKKSVQLNTPRPHKTRSELNSESSLRRRPNRECRHERRSRKPARRAPKRAAPPPSAPRPARPGGRGSATAPPRTAQPGAGRDPSARGRPRSPGAAAARAVLVAVSAAPYIRPTHTATCRVGPPRKTLN